MENSQLPRAVVAYKPTNQIFLQKERNYIQQYSHVYLKRLLALRPKLQAFASQARHLNLAEKVIGLNVGEHLAVIGTLYKEQKLKPNVLDEFSNEVLANGLAPKRENYASEDDTLLLEDESGRCNLIGREEEAWKTTVGSLVSGIVVACVGKLLENGTFEVEDIIFAGDALPREMPRFVFSDAIAPRAQAKRFLVLVSGLYAGSTAENNSVLLQLLVDYIGGLFDANMAASITRIVIAGGAISPPRLDDAFKDTTIDAKLQVESQEVLVESLRVADRWFAELASTCPVDVMPGEHDPCNISLPQQPLHPCLFPASSRFANSFKTASNPYSFVLGDNLNVLGHSGQPIRDALRYMMPGTSPCELLERTVFKYRHLAPTAPDTLPCYPFYDRDPFVLEKDNCQVCFAGGFAAFESRYSRGTRFICVPEFKRTKQLVLVDLDSTELDASVVSFDVDI